MLLKIVENCDRGTVPEQRDTSHAKGDTPHAKRSVPKIKRPQNEECREPLSEHAAIMKKFIYICPSLIKNIAIIYE